MIYIRKRKTPLLIRTAADNIKKDPIYGYSTISLPYNTLKLRELFDMMPKDDIREYLFKEQHEKN